MCFVDVKAKYTKLKWLKWEHIFKEEVWDEKRDGNALLGYSKLVWVKKA